MKPVLLHRTFNSVFIDSGSTGEAKMTLVRKAWRKLTRISSLEHVSPFNYAFYIRFQGGGVVFPFAGHPDIFVKFEG